VNVLPLPVLFTIPVRKIAEIRKGVRANDRSAGDIGVGDSVIAIIDTGLDCVSP
jgi:hypothetical protein